MKRQWDAEELVENFTLLPTEMALLSNKSEENRLGFAVLLKFFQMEAKFPRTKQEVPKQIVSYIARLLEASPKQYGEYSFNGRTIERHRAEIREFFGFREFNPQDKTELIAWLCEFVLAYDRQASSLEAAVYQRLRELKLEPPIPEAVERLIRSAVVTTEKEFCAGIFNQIESETLTKMDALLNTQDALDDNISQFKQSVFNFLKTDPGRTSLKSIFKEVSKLECIRDLGLPTKLFANVLPKIITHYRRRASAETPRELRRHPAKIRYTLVAAFCWQRNQEITDSLVELLIQIIHRIYVNAERRVDKQLIEEFKRVDGKPRLLFEIAQASLERPEEPVKDVVYPVVSPKTLQAVVKEYKSNSPTYEEKVYTVMRSSYLLRQQYDQMIKYTTALRLGTAEADTILKRFSRSSPQHPTQKALSELGRAVKTIFLCHYLNSEALRREINEGLNVVENWNSANGFIFYGKNSEIATNRLNEQELSVLCLHLLQISLVYINTLMIQRVLAEATWMKQMRKEDFRALSPLIWVHVNPSPVKVI